MLRDRAAWSRSDRAHRPTTLYLFVFRQVTGDAGHEICPVVSCTRDVPSDTGRSIEHVDRGGQRTCDVIQWFSRVFGFHTRLLFAFSSVRDGENDRVIWHITRVRVFRIPCSGPSTPYNRSVRHYNLFTVYETAFRNPNKTVLFIEILKHAYA